MAVGSFDPGFARWLNAAEFVVGNLDEDGYLAASEEEMAEVFAQILYKEAHTGRELRNGSAPDTAKALELIRRGIDLVQHLDPAGVGARDLRECLLIQIVGSAAGVCPSLFQA